MQLVVGEQDNGAGDAELPARSRVEGRRSPAGRAADEDGLPQAEVDLTKEWLACFRKWYRDFHRKWLYENTMRCARLDGVAGDSTCLRDGTSSREIRRKRRTL